MNERFEKLLELNKNMDEIIAVAKIETDKMQIEVEQYKTDAVNRLFKVLEDIKPMMDVICSSLKINQYGDGYISLNKKDYFGTYPILSYGNPNKANYGIKIHRPETSSHYGFTVYVWNGEIYTHFISTYNHDEIEQKYINNAKEFIAENINEITEKLYKKVESLLIETIENKAKKQKELQEDLQTKLGKFKTE